VLRSRADGAGLHAVPGGAVAAVPTHPGAIALAPRLDGKVQFKRDEPKPNRFPPDLIPQ